MTLIELENLFQSLTATILGVDPDSGVRILYPEDGAPAWGIFDNMVFIHPHPEDNLYNRVRETDYRYAASPEEFVRRVTYTRVTNVKYILYGPASFDYAEMLRDAMFYEENRALLARNNLYLIPNVEEPLHLHELFEGRWWERMDMAMRFNELVSRTTSSQYIKSGDIIIEASDGILLDINIP